MSDEMHEMKDLMKSVSDLETAVGMAEMADGLNTLEVAEAIGNASRETLASAAGNMTRSADEALMSRRTAALSDIVAQAGNVDFAEGVEMLATSEDLDVQSALVNSLGLDGLDTAMSISAIAGQLETVATVMAEWGMPILAAFLDEKQDELHDLAVEEIFKAAAMKALAESVKDSGAKVGALGANEMAEGLTRMAVSDDLAAHSNDLAADAMVHMAGGLAEMIEAEELHDAALDLAALGITGIASGSAELGNAAGIADAVDILKET